MTKFDKINDFIKMPASTKTTAHAQMKCCTKILPKLNLVSSFLVVPFSAVNALFARSVMPLPEVEYQPLVPIYNMQLSQPPDKLI